jgi:large subunit ribosomal protein L21
MTFAIIETGAKQYKVKKGDIIKIERLEGENKAGDTITFDAVILTDDGKKTEVGNPTIKGAKVEGKFIEEAKGKKISSLRFKNKTNQGMGVRRGHRQIFNSVEITKI